MLVVDKTLKSDIEKLLASARDPFCDAPLGSLARVSDCVDGKDTLDVSIQMSYPVGDGADTLRTHIEDCLREYAGRRKLVVELGHEVSAATAQAKLSPLQEVRNIIAVASAKGGVGKSTVAVNLALGMAALGAKVGILDGDIYGPSQQIMLGVPPDQKPDTQPPKYLLPIEAHGLQSMSIGYLLTDKTPLAWRGPMVSGALQQMVTQTLWKDLDYLIVDMPPGTGDIQLTLAQKVPVAGVVVVTTPQDLALADARRGVLMFQKVKVPVLGLIENMSRYICPHCGEQETLFGSGGGERLARECKLPLLGSVPLEPAIQTKTDGGTPIVIADPDAVSARLFTEMARQLAALVAMQPRASKNMRLDVRNITDAMA